MKLEKKSGITYGQPQRQPLGVWGSAEVEAQQLGHGEMSIRGHKKPYAMVRNMALCFTVVGRENLCM